MISYFLKKNNNILKKISIYTCTCRENVIKYKMDMYLSAHSKYFIALLTNGERIYGQMYIHDSHIHTKFSFDSDSDISDIAEVAIARGISEISLCDHCDIDNDLAGIYPKFKADDARVEILAAKEKYAGRLRINYGVELGEAHACPKESRELMERMGYDFVIGSLHNLRGYPDFSLLKYEHMSVEQRTYLMRRMLSETEEIVDFGGFSTLAHITYIQRYLTLSGVPFEYEAYKDDFARIFGKLIASGIALEINTSGLRRNSITMPSYELAALYKECGGELITFGSDAHLAQDIGKGIEEAAAALRSLGFKSQCVVRGGRLTQIEL